MAVTVDSIRNEFPEFAKTSPVIIAAKLADAAAQLTPESLGTMYDVALKNLTCHLIASTPGGEFARLDPAKEPDGACTIYERVLNRVYEKVPGPMVI